MSTETKNYSPLPRMVTKRILDIWDFYKEVIGLEGDLAYKMRSDKSRKYSDEEIKQALSEHRKNRTEMMPLYEEYKQEKREEDERENQEE